MGPAHDSGRFEPFRVPHDERSVRVAGLQRVGRVLPVLRARAAAAGRTPTAGESCRTTGRTRRPAAPGLRRPRAPPGPMCSSELGYDVSYITECRPSSPSRARPSTPDAALARARRVLVEADARRRRSRPRPRREPRVLRSQRRLPPDPLRAFVHWTRPSPGLLQGSKRQTRCARPDPSLVTVNWRDPPVNRPESAMIGEQYECNPVRADMVITDPGAWVFEGTGVTAGQRLVEMASGPSTTGTWRDQRRPGTSRSSLTRR